MRLQLGETTLELGRRAAVMGIVNRTPDSFYDGGATFDVQAAVDAALAHVHAGADVVDIGGVKGGPGEEVGVEQEIDRVVPVVEAVRARSRAPLSVETWRADVAAAALDAGANMVNDISGLAEPRLAEVVARRPGTALVVMHAGGPVRTRPLRPVYEPDVTTAVVDELERLAALAEQHGVPSEQIVVDPGHDFGKNTFHSLELTRRLPDIVALGRPVLVALSRKDFLGETVGGQVAPADRLPASLAAAAVAVHLGAHLVRVHDTAATVDAVRTVEAVAGRLPPAAAARGLA